VIVQDPQDARVPRMPAAATATAPFPDEPFPDERVRLTSIYSKGDDVVRCTPSSSSDAHGGPRGMS
jgi:hypothetical protein